MNNLLRNAFAIGVIAACSLCFAQSKGGGCAMAYEGASAVAMQLATLAPDAENQTLLQESADFDEAARWAQADDDAFAQFCTADRLAALRAVTADLQARLREARKMPDKSAADAAVKNVDRWLKGKR